MKKIAEIRIGSHIPNYDKYGTPSVFVSWDGTKYKAFCTCGGTFYFNWWKHSETITCPCCGTIHQRHEIMDNHDKHKLMPFKLYIRLIDLKDRVEIRISYDAVSLDTKAYYARAIVRNCTETYVFDMKRHEAYWCSDCEEQNRHEKIALGYLTSLEELIEKTALWYIAADHKIHSGVSVTVFLQKLRKTVNAHMNAQGLRRKKLYIPSCKRITLLANILAVAHKVRFWDADLLPYGGKGSMDFSVWKQEVLQALNLPNEWEQKTEEGMKNGMTYQEALLSALHLPNKPFVRKNLHYETLFSLIKACSLPTADMAYMAFSLFLKLAKPYKEWYRYYNHIAKINDICEFANTFYPLYPTLKARQFIHELAQNEQDLLRLWHVADKKTIADYHKAHVPFRKLHDWLSVAVTEQKDRECIFRLDENVVTLLNQTIQGYTFRCVERKSELRKIAVALKNCSLSFAGMVGKTVQLVGVTDSDGRIKALIEIRENQIVQGKLFANKPICASDSLNRACVEYVRRIQLSCNTTDIQLKTA